MNTLDSILANLDAANAEVLKMYHAAEFSTTDLEDSYSLYFELSDNIRKCIEALKTEVKK